jgi:hypothetical protein
MKERYITFALIGTLTGCLLGLIAVCLPGSTAGSPEVQRPVGFKINPRERVADLELLAVMPAQVAEEAKATHVAFDEFEFVAAPADTPPAPADTPKAWKESELRAMIKTEIVAAMPEIKQAVKDAVREAIASQPPPPPPAVSTVTYSAGACGSQGVVYYSSAGACASMGASACASSAGASACGSGSTGGRMGLFGRLRARRAGGGAGACGG